MRIENLKVAVKLCKNNAHELGELYSSSCAKRVEYHPYGCSNELGERDEPLEKYSFDSVYNCSTENEELVDKQISMDLKVDNLVAGAFCGYNFGLLCCSNRIENDLSSNLSLYELLHKIEQQVDEFSEKNDVYVQSSIIGVTDLKCMDLRTFEDLESEVYRNLDYYWEEIADTKTDISSLIQLIKNGFSLPYIILLKIIVYPKSEDSVPTFSYVMLGNLGCNFKEATSNPLNESLIYFSEMSELFSSKDFLSVDLPVDKYPLTSILSKFLNGNCSFNFILSVDTRVKETDDLQILAAGEKFRHNRSIITQNYEDFRFRDLADLDELTDKLENEYKVLKERKLNDKLKFTEIINFLTEKVDLSALELKESLRNSEIAIEKWTSKVDFLSSEKGILEKKLNNALKENTSMSEKISKLTNEVTRFEDEKKILCEELKGIQNELLIEKEGHTKATKKFDSDIGELKKKFEETTNRYEKTLKEKEEDIKKLTKDFEASKKGTVDKSAKLQKEIDELNEEMETIKEAKEAEIKSLKKSLMKANDDFRQAESDLEMEKVAKESEIAILKKEIATLKKLTKDSSKSESELVKAMQAELEEEKSSREEVEKREATLKKQIIELKKSLKDAESSLKEAESSMSAKEQINRAEEETKKQTAPTKLSVEPKSSRTKRAISDSEEEEVLSPKKPLQKRGKVAEATKVKEKEKHKEKTKEIKQKDTREVVNTVLISETPPAGVVVKTKAPRRMPETAIPEATSSQVVKPKANLFLPSTFVPNLKRADDENSSFFSNISFNSSFEKSSGNASKVKIPAASKPFQAPSVKCNLIFQVAIKKPETAAMSSIMANFNVPTSKK